MFTNIPQLPSIIFRFLATGETYTSLAYQYRVGVTTVSRIVPEVCIAIWDAMKPKYLCMPTSPEGWIQIAAEFYQRWHYPHCVGALDGKHIIMKAPFNSGSLYFNYKGSFSIVLMALVDAGYKFICVDIGSYGRQSDAGIFSRCELGKALLPPNSLNLPEDAVIEESRVLGPLPYVVIGDEAFPLQRHVMRPYPGRAISEMQEAYNYRHSRARRIVECAFGLLATRWRVFYSKIGVCPEHVTAIVQAATVLHNMLQLESTPANVQELLRDNEPNQVEGLQALSRTGYRATRDASHIRSLFTRYFVEHPLSWQTSYIQRGLHDT